MWINEKLTNTGKFPSMYGVSALMFGRFCFNEFYLNIQFYVIKSINYKECEHFKLSS